MQRPFEIAGVPVPGYPSVSLEWATEFDFASLNELRTLAMKESLERIGRYDPERSRERFRASFMPAETRHILLSGGRVGFVAVACRHEFLQLDHLYLHPNHQSLGIGKSVVRWLLTYADSVALPVKVVALKESESNRFYMNLGFNLVDSTEFDCHYLRPAVVPPSDPKSPSS